MVLGTGRQAPQTWGTGSLGVTEVTAQWGSFSCPFQSTDCTLLGSGALPRERSLPAKASCGTAPLPVPQAPFSPLRHSTCLWDLFLELIFKEENPGAALRSWSFVPTGAACVPSQGRCEGWGEAVPSGHGHITDPGPGVSGPWPRV